MIDVYSRATPNGRKVHIRLKALFDSIALRPAVQSGIQFLADQRKLLMDDRAREMIVDATQYQCR
ncbi:MAG: hypothetical protein ACK5RC_11625 [Curvibacter sp.]|jgi:GST-like protein|nr:hypothetical protein [Curvibacter sp.]